MKPLVERLKSEYTGKVEVRRMNVQSDQEGIRLAEAAKAQYVPTFLFFDSQGNKVDMLVGGATYDQLKAKIDALK
jgi:thiol-disulfide isomerase/thioredoxin